MIQSYKDGVDIYSSLASHVFTQVAKGFTDKLTGRNTQVSDLVHYASPLYKYILDKKFVYLDHSEPGDLSNGLIDYNVWTSREIEISDCFDGSLFRKFMKTILLGMMYSMSEKGLAARLKIEAAEAKEIMDFFFMAFPKVKQAMNYFKIFCKKNGYVQTIEGRKRRIPEIYSEEWFVRSKAERQVLNSVIQGSAADLMKKALIKIGNDERLVAIDSFMLINVHDEVLLECPNEHAVEACQYVIEDMTSIAELSLPLKVDGEIFIDGRWYGESVTVKNKGGVWKILKDVEVEENGKTIHKSIEISEEEIEWTC